MNSLTYQRTKKIIQLTIKAGALAYDYLTEMRDNLDLFKIGGRITKEEYTELVNMLNAEDTK